MQVTDVLSSLLVWAGFKEQGWALTEQAGCFGNRLFGCCWVGMRSQHIPCKQIILNFFGKITLILSSMNRTEPGNVLHEWPRMHAIIAASFFKFLYSSWSFNLTIWQSVLGSSGLHIFFIVEYVMLCYYGLKWNISGSRLTSYNFFRINFQNTWNNQTIIFISLHSPHLQRAWMGCAANALTDREAKSFGKTLKNTNQLQTEGSFFRKMKHEVTLRSEILSQLDFKSAPRDVVFTCLDGQVL